MEERQIITDEVSVDTTEVAAESKEKIKVVTPYIIASAIFAIIALIVYLVSRSSVSFAEFYSRTISQWIRAAIGTLTGWFPFSLGETLLYSLIPLAVGYFIFTMRRMKKDERLYWKCVLPLIAIIFNILSLYVLGFGVCNFRYSLDKNLGLERNKVSAEELAMTSDLLSIQISSIIDEIKFIEEDASVMPYDYFELSRRLDDAFSKYASEQDYISHFYAKPKVIALSELMTYTHISGVYSFFTGEANVNVNYPDFVLPYTMAHEMSHQRGIAREDEANFVAFLVCMESEDPYIQYSALLNMQEYVLSALAKADKELYAEKYYGLPDEVRYELISYSKFFKKYEKSVAAQVTDKVNDKFLQANGQQNGTKSYGMVVDLTVALYKSIYPSLYDFSNE